MKENKKEEQNTRTGITLTGSELQILKLQRLIYNFYC